MGEPHLGLPLVWILEARASMYTWRASMPQMGIHPEKEQGMGKPVIPMTGLPLLSRKAFYTFLTVHRDQWVIQSYVALAAQTLTKTRLFSLHT